MKVVPAWPWLLVVIISLVSSDARAQRVRELYDKPITLNYKVEATVRMDGKVATGSSIWSLTARLASTGGGRVINGTVRGEAIPIDFGNGKYAFVLRRGAGEFTADVYGAHPLGCATQSENEAKLAANILAFQGPCVVRKRLPMVVAFSNLADPSSYVRSDLGQKPIAKLSCAPELCLERLVVTRTDADVTTGIQHLLPWLSRGSETSIIGTDEPQVGVGTDRPYVMDFSTEMH